MSHHCRQRPWRRPPTMQAQAGRRVGLLGGSEGRSEGGSQALAQFWWRKRGLPSFWHPPCPLAFPWAWAGTHTHTHSVTQLFHESVVRKILPLFLDPKTSPNYPSLTSWVWVRVCAHRQCHLACAGLPLAPPTVSL